MHVHNIITVIGATKFKKILLQIVLLLIGMNFLTVKKYLYGNNDAAYGIRDISLLIIKTLTPTDVLMP